MSFGVFMLLSMGSMLSGAATGLGVFFLLRRLKRAVDMHRVLEALK